MAIFNSYVSLPEGTWMELEFWSHDQWLDFPTPDTLW